MPTLYLNVLGNKSAHSNFVSFLTEKMNSHGDSHLTWKTHEKGRKAKAFL